MSKWRDPEGREMQFIQGRLGASSGLVSDVSPGIIAVAIWGRTNDELFARARRCGCAEVVEPKPCSNCGGEPRIYWTTNYGGSDSKSIVGCYRCGVQGPARFPKEAAVKEWNRITFNPADAG